jgi:hypothetical protein
LWTSQNPKSHKIRFGLPNEMNEEAKSWASVGTPCTPQDVYLFMAATKVIIGNGKKCFFLEASWVD